MNQKTSENKAAPNSSGPKLTPISLEKLKAWKLAPGMIYFLPKKGRPLLLFRAGEALLWERLEKFKGKNESSLGIQILINPKMIAEGELLLKAMLTLKSAPELWAKRKEFISWFQTSFLQTPLPTHQLNFIFMGAQIFYRLDETVAKKIQECSLIMFHRSLKVGMLSAVIALTLGYTDFKFLSDVYHVSLLLDYGLMSTEFSTFIMTACEEERKKSNAGITYLENLRWQQKQDGLDFFEQHPTLGQELVLKECKKVFYYPENAALIGRHHEYESGDGFPLGLKKSELSDFESICMMADALVSYEDQEESNFFAEIFGGKNINDNDQRFSLMLSKMKAEMMSTKKEAA